MINSADPGHWVSMRKPTIAAAVAIMLTITGCAESDRADSAGASEAPQNTPQPYSELTEELDTEIVEAVESETDIDYSSAEELQQAAAVEYARLLDETGDLAMAEASLAGLYSQELLDGKAESWTREAMREPIEFTDNHPGVAATSPDVDADADQGFTRLVWESECDNVEAHHLDIFIEVEDTDQGPVITQLSHWADCGCAGCTQAA